MELTENGVFWLDKHQKTWWHQHVDPILHQFHTINMIQWKITILLWRFSFIQVVWRVEQLLDFLMISKMFDLHPFPPPVVTPSDRPSCGQVEPRSKLLRSLPPGSLEPFPTYVPNSPSLKHWLFLGCAKLVSLNCCFDDLRAGRRREGGGGEGRPSGCLWPAALIFFHWYFCWFFFLPRVFLGAPGSCD